MKKIITTIGKYGPYETVEVLEDRYRVNGSADLPFTVIGQGEITDVVEGDFVPVVYVLPVVIPESVSMRQARLALLSVGKLSQVDDAIAAMSSPDKEMAQITWEYAVNVQRTDPLVSVLVSALGMDEAGVDQLFILAASL